MDEKPEPSVVRRALIVDAWPPLLGSTEPTPKLRLAGKAWAAFVILLLIFVAFPIGSGQFLKNEDQANFYRHFYEPAINLACTGQLQAFEVGPQAEAFLKDEVEVFRGCDEVASSRQSVVWDPFDIQSVYMYEVAALSFKLFGFQWESLHVFAGILASFFCVSCFLLLRAFSPSTILAAAATLAVFFAPIVQGYLPDLRDFSKAPFILGPLALIALAVTRPFRWRTVLLLFALAGAAVALGRGFRPDAAVVIPVAGLAVLLLGRQGERLLVSARRMLLTFGAFFVALVLFSLPLVLIAASKPEVGNLSPHFFVLGFAERFAQLDLGMPAASFSELRFYSDELAMLHSDAFVDGGGAVRELYGRTLYDAASGGYFLAMATTFPHDVFLRVPYALVAIAQQTIGPFAIGAPLIVCILIGAIGAPRAVIFGVLTFGLLIAISTLQFHHRHFFYLIVVWPALALCALSGVVAIVQRAGRKEIPVISRANLLGVTGTFAGISLSLFLGDAVLAALQKSTIRAATERYESLDWHPLPSSYDRQKLFLPLTDTIAGPVIYRLGLKSPERSSWPQPNLVWQPNSGGTIERSGEQLKMTFGPMDGYQFLSNDIPLASLRGEVNPTAISLNVDIVVDAPRAALGVLSGDKSHWIGSHELLRGAHRVSLPIEAAESETSGILVIEAKGGSGSVTVRQLEAMPTQNICFGDVIGLTQIYLNHGSELGGGVVEVPIRPAASYVFPAFFDRNFRFDHLETSAPIGNCEIEAAWAPIVKGEALPELIYLENGVVPQPIRARLWDALAPLFVGGARS